MFFLQSTPDPLFFNLIFFAAIFGVMYFFFMRPQIKKQKAQDQFVKDMSKGDEVVLASGIIGKITKMDEGTAQIQVDQKTFIRVLPNAISMEMTEAFKKAKSGGNKDAS